MSNFSVRRGSGVFESPNRSLELYDECPPVLRKAIRECHSNYGVRPILDRWRRHFKDDAVKTAEELRRLDEAKVAVSARTAYGPDHPQSKVPN